MNIAETVQKNWVNITVQLRRERYGLFGGTVTVQPFLRKVNDVLGELDVDRSDGRSVKVVVSQEVAAQEVGPEWYLWADAKQLAVHWRYPLAARAKLVEHDSQSPAHFFAETIFGT